MEDEKKEIKNRKSLNLIKELGLPVGYIFEPNNSELVSPLLKNKILGVQTYGDAIPTIDDLFSKNPDKFTYTDEIDYGKKDMWYFYTTRSKDDQLRTDDGYYRLSDAQTIKNEGNQVVGLMKTMNYYLGKPPNERKTDWIVQQFMIQSNIIETDNEVKDTKIDDTIRSKISDLVVCRVFQEKDNAIDSED